MRPTAGAAPRPRRGRRRTCHTPARRHECSAVRRATAVSAHASLVAKAKTTRGAGASRRNGSSVPRFIAQVSHPLFSWVHCTSVPPAFRREKRLALSASRPHRAQHVNGGPRKVPCGRALGRGLSVPRRARMSVPRRAQTAPTPPPPPRLLLPTAPAREHARVVPRRLCQQLQPRDQHCGVRAGPPQLRVPRARRRAATGLPRGIGRQSGNAPGSGGSPSSPAAAAAAASSSAASERSASIAQLKAARGPLASRAPTAACSCAQPSCRALRAASEPRRSYGRASCAGRARGGARG